MKGRCIRKSENVISLQNEKGIYTFQVTDPESIGVGDIAEVRDKEIFRLTPSSSSPTWTQRILDPRRRKAVAMRLAVENQIRAFFNGEGFLETRTPLLAPCPGMEPHIRPFGVVSIPGDTPKYYLPTSPEFAMKKLLVGGLEKIFQITPAFRDEPVSVTHLPEFTMLEWYRAYAGYDDIMSDVENLFSSLAQSLLKKDTITYQGKEISVRKPWPRLKIRDLFKKYADVDLADANREKLASVCKGFSLSVNPDETWDDLYFKIWLNQIEPHLPSDQAVFVYRYPPSQAALSVTDRDPDGSVWAKRFEVYMGGIELANAFEELTDAVEQRKRFEKDMKLRSDTYGASFPITPTDEAFLNALEQGMPPSGGIAMGVDRMIMLFADEPDIGYTFWI
jgi:elongation factor P--(R)-beta-lysine ligase